MSETTLLKKVFFIDDDAPTNAFHEALANEVNLAEELQFFQDAQVALDALNGIQKPDDYPDLILVDINMPGYNGHEFIKELQKSDTYPESDCKVVMLTSSKDIRDVIAADENEVQFYYWKPLNQELIHQILREVFETSC
jgi:DNA-binding NarL/FixJ family response regulator